MEVHGLLLVTVSGKGVLPGPPHVVWLSSQCSASPQLLWMGSMARRLRSTKEECVRWQIFLFFIQCPFPSLERRATLGRRELSLEIGELSLPQWQAAPMISGQTQQMHLAHCGQPQ